MQQIQVQPQFQLCLGKLPTVRCECGCMITKKGISAHRKTAKHSRLMAGFVSPIRLSEHNDIITPLKTASNTRIGLLPQPIQDLIYEYAADRSAKDHFIAALPELFRFKLNLPSNDLWNLSYVKTAQLTFYTDFNQRGHQYSKFEIKFKTDDIITVRKFDSLERLADHIYYGASRRWAANSSYDETDRLGSLIKVMRDGFNFETFDTLHAVSPKNIQTITQGEFNETTHAWDQYTVPYYMQSLMTHHALIRSVVI